MNTQPSAARARPSRAVRAEAALWLARLRSPERNADAEQGFRLWLDARPEHASAFELATELWERSAAVRRHPHEQAMSWVGPGYRGGRRMLAAAAVLAAIAVGATAWYLQRDVVTTSIGEQRTLTLEDGSRLFLNTDTRAVVQYNARERRIRLDKGEALFEVAKQTARPFIVSAGVARVEALGTSFVVRRDAQQLAVTLVEGKVSVAAMSDDEAALQLSKSRILSPGERLTMLARHQPTVDRPVLDKLTAWQRGQVAFDNVPLSDAVAEMNRYSAVQLAIEQPAAARVLIGGVFRTGDADSFAEAMAATYRLRIIEEDNKIVLSGAPEAPPRSAQLPR